MRHMGESPQLCKAKRYLTFGGAEGVEPCKGNNVKMLGVVSSLEEKSRDERVRDLV